MDTGESPTWKCEATLTDVEEIVQGMKIPLCRAFLSPYQDENGQWIFYGRGNLGVQYSPVEMG